MLHYRPRLVRASIPVALALAFLLAPLADGGGYTGRNGYVVYLSGTNVRASDGTTLETDASDAAVNPGLGASLSPNAKRLAYTRGTPPATTVRVDCIATTPCAEADTDLAAGSSQPSWSADGTRIAYVDIAGEIAFSDANGGNVVATGAVGAEPAWSPDGTKIAFASLRGAHYEIWTVAAEAVGAQSQITGSLSSNDRQPAWSPDGSQIAFHSNRSGTNQIYTVSAAGGGLTQLTSDSSASTTPVWSPDGSRIAFTRSSQVYDVAAVGGSATAVPGTAGVAETADWQTLVPLNTAAPQINAPNPPSQGDTVSATTGTWKGASSFTYEWQRCDQSGGSCVTIGGATSSSYTLSSSDVGLRVRAHVLAANTAGTSEDNPPAVSEPTAVVLGPGPKNTSRPVISGTPKVGSSVSASVGTWTGGFNTYSFQWWKCDAVTKACSDLPEFSSSFLTVTADLFGWQLRVLVTARNADGVGSAVSELTATVTADLPVNLTRPLIAGINIVGETLSAGTGTWTGSSPIRYVFQWKRCDPAGTLPSCVAIPGATAALYTLTANDVGIALRAYVTAINVAGSTDAFTDHSFPTLPAGTTRTTSGRPASSAPPAITGTAATGSTLTANAGTWSGQSPIRYSYAWRRCDATGAACRRIAGATAKTYKLRRGDVGFTLRVAVVARNTLGSTAAVSLPSDAVQLSKPVPRGRRVVGTARADYLPGGGGNDVIIGRAGNDTVLGGAGNDRLDAGPGNDVVDGGAGIDRIDAGPGSDTVRAADGSRDLIDCGDGRDHAVVDRDDVVTGCELVTFGTATTTPPTTPAP